MKKKLRIAIIFLAILMVLYLSLLFSACDSANSRDDFKYSFQDFSDTYTKETRWTYGIEEQDATKQDVNNWFYLYTDETNTNGIYDLQKIAKCTYSEDLSCWITGANNDCSKISIKNNNIAFQSADSSMVLAFKAPSDGSYLFEIGFTAGNSLAMSGGDGVRVSIYAGNTSLYTQNISDGVSQGDYCEVTAMLKKNEFCYFIVDPNQNNINDICDSLRIYVFQKFDKYVDNTTSWGFGEFIKNNHRGQQGFNNWYYLFTKENNTSGKYDISKIKECTFTPSRKDPFSNYVCGNWSPELYTTAPDEGLYFDENITAVIGFKAPRDGNYTIITEFIVSPDYTDSNDGITVSFYNNTTCIKSVLLNNYGQKRYYIENELKKGEYFYLFVDPNNNSNDDSVINLDIYVEEK